METAGSLIAGMGAEHHDGALRTMDRDGAGPAAGAGRTGCFQADHPAVGRAHAEVWQGGQARASPSGELPHLRPPIGHHRPGGLHAADDPGHHPAHRRLLRLHAGSGGRPQSAGHGLLGADHGNADLLSRAGLLRNDMEDVWRGLSLRGNGGAGRGKEKQQARTTTWTTAAD